MANPTDIRSQLKRDEGTVLFAYQDNAAERYWTIGTGRLIDHRKGGGISPDEADYLLDNDIHRVRAAIYAALPWADKLDATRLGVLLNMAFQLGVTGLLEFKRTLAEVEAGNYAQAAADMLLSAWAKQTPERAQRLANQMGSGIWN